MKRRLSLSEAAKCEGIVFRFAQTRPNPDQKTASLRLLYCALPVLAAD